MDVNIHIETERVIAEVRKRPALWNRSYDLYKNYHGRNQWWAEVFEAVVPGYSEFDAAKKSEIERGVRQRWKTARDAYIRSKSLARSNRKTYIYQDHMVFLDQNSTNDMNYSVDTPPTNDDWDPFSTYNQDSSTTSDQSMQETKPDVELLSNAAQVTADPAIDDCTSENIVKNVGKRKPSDGEESQIDILNMLKDGKHINDDLAFFISLLPITENFTNQQKLAFRLEILKKAMEIYNQNPNDESSSSTPPKRTKR